MENSREVLKNLKLELLYYPAIPLLGIYPDKAIIHTHTHTHTHTHIMEYSVPSSVQLLSRVQFFATSWTAARQASLSITNSQSLLKLMSIESVMPSNHLILCRPLLLLPLTSALGCFSVNQFFASGGQSIGVSASASVLPLNIQDWFPSRLTGLISLHSKGLSRVFSNTSSKASIL